ncbi:MAG TPA: hypothetical protein VIS74_05295 [Chthoniobacterales bacterium]
MRRNKADEDAVCDRCGRPAALRFEGEWLCAECVQARGSCCLEFGSDDLWRFDETDVPASNRAPAARGAKG